jgi:sortase A
MTCRRLFGALGFILITAGLSALCYCGLYYFDALWHQNYYDRELRGALGRLQPSGPPRAPENGRLIGRLEIPRLGLSTVVLEGTDEVTLRRAAGHIPGTALPGRPGNVGIAAHRDTFFRPLREIRKQDSILLTTLQGTRHYQVESIRIVFPQDVRVLKASGERILTLVTCYPFYFVGHAPRRFVVQAREVSGPAPSASTL